MHAEPFDVSISGLNEKLLYSRKRACYKPKEDSDCGEYTISYTYFAPAVNEGAKIMVTDKGTNHKLDKDQQGADIYFTAHPAGVKITWPDPDTFTFVSEDPPGTPVQIKAYATTGYLKKDNQIIWTVVDSPKDSINSGDPVPEETMAGRTITFFPNPPAAPNGRGDPLAYKITAKVTAYGYIFPAKPVTITQDEIDQCRQEYIDMNKARVPERGEFSNSGGTEHFTFDELNSGHYSWGIITDALYTGLEATRTNYSHPMDVSSGYRNPIHNADEGGVPESRHIYGLAADIYVRDLNGNGDIERSEWDVLADAAEAAGAWVEPWEDTGTWVHMDWGH